ncbi:INO80 complex subunit D-like [Salvelinus namaycush]|uniref:INO80 complex subunit D-like n=1 Tax=Salvelinus namaycush TaxID=8040 RepID=A0A8U1F6G3_SALNM|nr:INO80 complex subunit D-like [Salvelinus namaycush]
MYEGKHIHFSEVDNKPLCSYSPKLCKQRRLNGYAFCIRHVLEDKTAPFKQCEYVAKYNSQRCTNPIPKSEDRRYCNSHLQVLGFIPKKERKKKHDALEEMRSRPHLESVALNITVPSLALKASNGLDELPPSPPCTRLLPLPDGELLDPFAFYEEDTDGEEGPPRKGSTVRKKLHSRLVLSQKLQLPHHDNALLQPPPEHFSPSPLTCVHRSSPLRPHLPHQQQTGLLQPTQHSTMPSFVLPGQQQTGLLQPSTMPSFVLPGQLQTGLLQPSTMPSFVLPGQQQTGLPQPSTMPSFVLPGQQQTGLPQPSTMPSFVLPGQLQTGLLQPSTMPSFVLPGQLQGLSCKLAPPQIPAFLPVGLPPNTAPSPLQSSCAPLGRKALFTATHLPSSSWDSTQRHVVAMRPAAFSPPLACMARLQHLVQLCTQRHQEHGDLFHHLGLDWSEDSSEDDEVEAERVPPYHNAWRLQEGHLQDVSDEDAGSSRRTRLARLCSYLQEKYKHLCRQERATIRQKKYHYAFRKALLHAASKDPDCAGQLIQKLRKVSQTSSAPGQQETGICTGSTKGQACSSRALPFTRHCFQHILLNRSQQLFSSCTAKFADGQQCSIPVFDITHQTPLCEEHAKKMDNFLRGDGNRRVQHHQQQQRKPRKKTKPPALTKKHKKKRRRGPWRPQKPIPPALPQGNLGMPSSSSLTMPTQANIRSPSTPELSTDELPDDITNDMSDIPNDLELNQEDFSDVLPRLPDDLQDFDLFEGKNGELLPTTEEAEELVRALQAGLMGSYPDSLVCLTSMAELAQADGVDHRAMAAVFTGPGVQPGGMGDLLNGRIPVGNFSELEDNLLHSAGGHFSPSVSPQQPTAQGQTPPSGPSLTTSTRTVPRTHPPHILAKPEAPTSSPQGSHYCSEHVSSSYNDHMSSPHANSFQTDSPLLMEVPITPRSSWNNLPLPLTDPTQFRNLIRPEGHLVSTSLSTPPSSHSVTLQPMAALSALPQSGLTGLTALPAPSPPHDLLISTLPKQQLPQFSAAFGHQLASHSGIPKDRQPSHSSTAPPTGFSIASATAASANSATPPFPHSN